MTRRANRLYPTALALAVVLLTAAPAVQAADRAWQWRETKGESVALVGPRGVLWQFNYAKGQPKPYFHPLATADGQVLTENAPPDHAWHHALWFAWKFVNGLNYWEPSGKHGAGGKTEWTNVRAETRDDHSAHIVMDVAYRPPDAEPVLTEKRVVDVSAPGASGVYRIDWTATFTAGAKDVVLNRTPLPGEPGGKGWGGYAGLSVRLANNLSERKAVSNDGPVPLEGDKYRGKHTAMDYSGLVGGKPAGIAILDHPTNLNAPTPWYVIVGKPMSYFSPAVICYKPHTLKAGKSLTLRYRVLVHPDRWDAKRLMKEYDAFAR